MRKNKDFPKSNKITSITRIRTFLEEGGNFLGGTNSGVLNF